MRPRRLLRYHSLKRPKIRQTWNKYNLYNISRLRIPDLVPKTYFQQKWFAKAMARTYHGEHINEKRWERMFDRRLLSVVNMHPAYMARYNGSEQAAGRGSGREQPPEPEGLRPRGMEGTNAPNTKMTPYMQMMFAPQERRLDIAIFRALFASSARQARQMVVHGAVKVNGLKMQYPAYLLNPGDMFQVDVEKVLFATGKMKAKGATPQQPLKLGQRVDLSRDLDELRAVVNNKASFKEKELEQQEAEEEELEEYEAWKPASEETPEENELSLEDTVKAELKAEVKADVDQLKAMFLRARNLAKLEVHKLSAKKKQDLRALTREIKVTMSKAPRRNPSEPRPTGAIEKMQIALGELEQAVVTDEEGKNTGRVPSTRSSAETNAAETPEVQGKQETQEEIRDREHLETLEKRLETLRLADMHNPYDPKKPYATPWRPRPYMAPFAFIPRYLEVNQKICAAVYLRHPVARQGNAEVPTPYPPELNQLAFNWYLRRS